MLSNDFNNAFMQLEALNEADFNLSGADVDEIKNFLSSDEVEDADVKVIDLDADSEQDLSSDNVGKIILQCPCCETLVMKDAKDIELPENCEDGECTVQLGDQCPVCFSEESYNIVGKVAPYEDVTVTVEPKTDAEDTTEEELSDEELEAAKALLASYDIDCEECAQKVAEATKAIGEAAVKELIEMGIPAETEEVIADEATDAEDAVEEAEDELEESLTEGTEPECTDANCCECGTSEACEKEEYLCDDKPHIGRPTKVEFAANKEDTAKINKILSQESMTEGLNDIQLETENDKISIHAEKKDNGDEMIAPLDFEDANEIVDTQTEDPANADYLNDVETEGAPVDDFGAGTEEIPADTMDEAPMAVDEAPLADEELPEDETADVDIDEIEEESLNQLGESYFKQTYDNVKSYVTESIREDANQLICEGIITFDSGNQRKTQFILEGNVITPDGKCQMLVENAQITPGQKAMALNGKIENKKFIAESFDYNYVQDGAILKGSIRTH